jgi:tetratricopeptide (TPR) repeat protein
MGRGRWLENDKNKIEVYAENMEHKWLSMFIIPYIEETYKKEVNALNDWILSNVGIKLPLSTLVGDPRKTLKNGFVKMTYAVDEYFYDFVKEIYRGKGKNEARIDLATSFHYSDVYDTTLEIIETVLEIYPNNVKALILKADTFVHQGKCKEAEQIVREVLLIDKDEFEAWYILSDIFFEQAEWKKLLEVSEKALNLSPENWYRDRITLYQVKAMIEVGDLYRAEEKLIGISNSKRKMVIKKINELKEEITSKKKQVGEQ